MRIIGLLSWFDEDPAFLTRAISSHAEAGLLDALVAVDGRYALYGSGPAMSSPEEVSAIEESCRAGGVDLYLAWRRTPWPGEVHKRRALFRHGLSASEGPEDWFWIIDGDNELIEHPDADEVRARLSSTSLHAAEVILSEPGRKWDDVRRPMRQLFRALPGFAPYGRHWHYVARDGEEWVYLWGPRERCVPALEVHDLVVRHHHMDRAQKRRNTAYSYYAERDARQVEQTPGWVVTGPDGYPLAANGEEELV